MTLKAYEQYEKMLEKEPYIIGKVWQKIEIVPCKIGPSFEGLFK